MKKTLLSCALMLFFSAAMLIGTTYAWWEDSIATKTQIKAGNLDVTFEVADESLPNWIWYNLEDGDIFDVIKQEPGSTDTRLVKITNTGNIPLAYRIVLTDRNTAFNEFITFDLTFRNNNYKFLNDVNYRAFESYDYVLLTPGQEHIFEVTYNISTDLEDNAENQQLLAFDVILEAEQVAKAEGLGTVHNIG